MQGKIIQGKEESGAVSSRVSRASRDTACTIDADVRHVQAAEALRANCRLVLRKNMSLIDSPKVAIKAALIHAAYDNNFPHLTHSLIVLSPA